MLLYYSPKLVSAFPVLVDVCSLGTILMSSLLKDDILFAYRIKGMALDSFWGFLMSSKEEVATYLV